MEGMNETKQISNDISVVTVANSIPEHLDQTPHYPQFLSSPCDVLKLISTTGIMLVIPIFQLTIGIIYQNDCSMDRFIPIYMTVSGATGTLFILILALSVSHMYDCNTNSF